MEEEFTIYVSEEELAEFPEQETSPNNTLQEEKSPVQTGEKKGEEEIPSDKSLEKKDKPKIPSLLDLKIPKVYATRRNGNTWRRNQQPNVYDNNFQNFAAPNYKHVQVSISG